MASMASTAAEQKAARFFKETRFHFSCAARAAENAAAIYFLEATGRFA
jgi:hypothetical protein